MTDDVTPPPDRERIWQERVEMGLGPLPDASPAYRMGWNDGFGDAERAAPTPADRRMSIVWLIERGQPEGLANPQWWGVTDSRTGAYGWVDSAFAADQFATRAEAEAVIARFNRPGHPFNARAVEHGFSRETVAVPASADGLDAAWAAVEAALPEGWSFWELTEYSPDPGEPRRVSARVRTANVIHSDGTVPEVSAFGPTPTAALQALAARLTERTGS